MATIKIDGITSLTCEDFKITTDDRQTLIEVDGGNTTQDYGHIASGDKMTVTCNWWTEDFVKVWDIYESRQLVDVQVNIALWEKCRIRILSYGWFEHFEGGTVKTELEIWRI